MSGVALQGVRPAGWSSIEAAAQALCAARGRARQLQRLVQASSVPIVIVDNERRQRMANQAARLLLRMTTDELEGVRIDDLTPPFFQPMLEDAWRRLIRDGSVDGRYELICPDRSRLSIAYCALANILPAQHLVVFAPANWPHDELEPVVPAAPKCETLTRREREVLALIATGADFDQIADELLISSATVRSHVRNAHRKLSARNRPHAIALAIQAGLIGARPDP